MRLLLLALVSLLTGTVQAQPAQRAVLRAFATEVERLNKLRYGPGEIQDEALEKAPRQMERLVRRYAAVLLQLRDTADYEFIYLAHSPDRRFALFSWDTRQGGTMIDYAAIALYRDTSGRIHTLRLRDPGDNPDNPLMHYDTVFQLATDRGPLYVAQGFGQGSTALPWQELRAFRVQDQRLVPAKVFPENEHVLFVEFDLHAFGEEERVPVIRIREGGRLLLYPEPGRGEGFSGTYTHYRFRNGRYRKGK